MKAVAIALIIGFCLLAGTPIASSSHHSGSRISCCQADEQHQGRIPCHGNSGMQSCTCKGHGSSGSSFPYQGCSGNCSAPSVIPQQPRLILRIKGYAARGYRRITSKNILEHETRRKLYEQIVAHPGVDLQSLTRLVEGNENTIRYHLEKIHSGGKIRITNTGGVSHYFENHGTYSDEEQVLLARMFASGSGRILKLVSEHPGLTRRELADILGVAGPTVTRKVGHLIADGLIFQQHDGRCTHYYPGWLDHFREGIRILR